MRESFVKYISDFVEERNLILMYFVDNTEFEFIKPWPKDDIDATFEFLEQSVLLPGEQPVLRQPLRQDQIFLPTLDCIPRQLVLLYPSEVE